MADSSTLVFENAESLTESLTYPHVTLSSLSSFTNVERTLGEGRLRFWMLFISSILREEPTQLHKLLLFFQRKFPDGTILRLYKKDVASLIQVGQGVKKVVRGETIRSTIYGQNSWPQKRKLSDPDSNLDEEWALSDLGKSERSSMHVCDAFDLAFNLKHGSLVHLPADAPAMINVRRKFPLHQRQEFVEVLTKTNDVIIKSIPQLAKYLGCSFANEKAGAKRELFQSYYKSYTNVVNRMLKVDTVENVIAKYVLDNETFVNSVVDITLGYFVLPMCPRPLFKIQLANTDDMCYQPKYDGERLQVHKLPSGEIKTFSRSGRVTTDKYRELHRQLKMFNATSFILDCEVVAFDFERDCILPFNVLMQRTHDGNAGVADGRLTLKLFVFDLLLFNGTSYINLPLESRIANLALHFTPAPNVVPVAVLSLIESKREPDISIEQALERAVARHCEQGCEGIVVKNKKELYVVGGESTKWYKIKRENIGQLDTLDLIVMGYFVGKGKRTGEIGALLVGTRNSVTRAFESITKVGTGFTDFDLRQLKKLLKPEKKRNSAYVTGLNPDVWCAPTLVIEVRFGNVTRSKVHMCDWNGREGFSLKFPSFVRVRRDKDAQLVNDNVYVRQIFQTLQ